MVQAAVWNAFAEQGVQGMHSVLDVTVHSARRVKPGAQLLQPAHWASCRKLHSWIS